MSNVDTELMLSCQAFTYELFHKLLGGEPNAELLSIMASLHTEQILALAACGYSFDDADRGVSEDSPVGRFLACAKSLDTTAEAADDLRGQYMKYLAGPMKGNAQPWESVYTSHRGLLFQETTLEVRNFYRSFGCIPAEYPHVADDHVALECGFMAVLARRASEALASGNTQDVEQLLDGERRFLTEHMLKWLPQFAEAIAARPGDSIYQHAVCALAAICESDARALESAVCCAA